MPISTPCPIATPITSIIIIILFHHQPHTRKWKAQTRGPLDTPAQIIRLKGVPYAPTVGSTLGLLVLAKSTPSLGGKNEEKHQQPCRQLIQAF